MSIPEKRLKEIELEESQKFEEEKARAYAREKLIQSEPWRRFGKTKFAAYTNAAILLGVMVVFFAFALTFLGVV